MTPAPRAPARAFGRVCQAALQAGAGGGRRGGLHGHGRRGRLRHRGDGPAAPPEWGAAGFRERRCCVGPRASQRARATRPTLMPACWISRWHAHRDISTEPSRRKAEWRENAARGVAGGGATARRGCAGSAVTAHGSARRACGTVRLAWPCTESRIWHEIGAFSGRRCAESRFWHDSGGRLPHAARDMPRSAPFLRERRRRKSCQMRDLARGHAGKRPVFVPDARFGARILARPWSAAQRGREARAACGRAVRDDPQIHEALCRNLARSRNCATTRCTIAMGREHRAYAKAE